MHMLLLDIALKMIPITENFKGVACTGTCDPGASATRLTRYKSVDAQSPMLVCIQRSESKCLLGIYAPSSLYAVREARIEILLGVRQSSPNLLLKLIKFSKVSMFCLRFLHLSQSSNMTLLASWRKTGFSKLDDQSDPKNPRQIKCDQTLTLSL